MPEAKTDTKPARQRVAPAAGGEGAGTDPAEMAAPPVIGEGSPAAASKEDPSSRSISGARKPRVDPDDVVTVTVPRAFRLTDDGHTTHSYLPGTYDMQRAHAQHSYALAHGVKPV